MKKLDVMPEEFSVTPYIQEIEVVARRGHKDVSTENLLLAFLAFYQEQPALIEGFILFFLRRANEQRLEFTPRAFRLSFLTALKLYLRMRDVKDYELFSLRRWKRVIRPR